MLTGTATSIADVSFTLQPGDSFEYEVFASAYINLEDDHRAAPVPEPSALAAHAATLTYRLLPNQAATIPPSTRPLGR